MFTSYINNILMFVFLTTIALIITGIAIKDCNSMSKHIKYCQEYCYPGVVVEEFSRYKCVCQTEVQLKYSLDKN